MKNLLLFTLLLVISTALSPALPNQESWATALAKMPMPEGTPLNRDNCMNLCLHSFQSNSILKGIVFLPSVANEFYLFSRDKPPLNIAANNLLDALIALTNLTPVRATFQKPFLLLHTATDALQHQLTIKSSSTEQRLLNSAPTNHFLCLDQHWRTLQPDLKVRLKLRTLPESNSIDAWHFGRHNFVGFNLSDWEVLIGLSLAGNTQVTLDRSRITFGPRSLAPLLQQKSLNR